MRIATFFALLLLVFQAGCSTDSGARVPHRVSAAPESESNPSVLAGVSNPEFGRYWYQGQAELTSYDLEQSRYGKNYPGQAVLIFVTEDFSHSKQVKLDHPNQAGEDAVKVLKLNFTKQFNTGIYPYSLMSSIFTPIDRKQHAHTLKVTTSAQEWCGHSFAQLNRLNDGYRGRTQSYFESDGDRQFELDSVVLEDELWNTIRLNPKDLPIGAFQALPGTFYERLNHGEWKPQEAKGSLEVGTDSAPSTYRIEYPSLERSLSIRFKASFPFEIESWEETYPSRPGPSSEKLTTSATIKKRILLDYWNKNNPEDFGLRNLLGLE